MQAAACGAYNSITEADIDGDGKLDVIALGLEGISVFRGNGDGTLQSCRKLDSAPTSHIIAKDFDGDGNIDLIAAVLYSTELRLLRGTGGGTFAPPVVIPLPDTFLAWALGDANGDSIPDLLVATSHIAVATLIVFRGSRDGPFTLGSSMSLGMSTVAASARWNLVFSNDPDGKPRLLVLDGSTIEILIGDGHGGFANALLTNTAVFRRSQRMIMDSSTRRSSPISTETVTWTWLESSKRSPSLPLELRVA